MRIILNEAVFGKLAYGYCCTNDNDSGDFELFKIFNKGQYIAGHGSGTLYGSGVYTMQRFVDNIRSGYGNHIYQMYIPDIKNFLIFNRDTYERVYSQPGVSTFEKNKTNNSIDFILDQIVKFGYFNSKEDIPKYFIDEMQSRYSSSYSGSCCLAFCSLMNSFNPLFSKKMVQNSGYGADGMPIRITDEVTDDTVSIALRNASSRKCAGFVYGGRGDSLCILPTNFEYCYPIRAAETSRLLSELSKMGFTDMNSNPLPTDEFGDIKVEIINSLQGWTKLEDIPHSKKINASYKKHIANARRDFLTPDYIHTLIDNMRIIDDVHTLYKQNFTSPNQFDSAEDYFSYVNTLEIPDSTIEYILNSDSEQPATVYHALEYTNKTAWDYIRETISNEDIKFTHNDKFESDSGFVLYWLMFNDKIDLFKQAIKKGLNPHLHMGNHSSLAAYVITHSNYKTKYKEYNDIIEKTVDKTDLSSNPTKEIITYINDISLSDTQVINSISEVLNTLDIKDVNEYINDSYNSETPLESAINSYRIEVINFLLSNYNINFSLEDEISQILLGSNIAFEKKLELITEISKYTEADIQNLEILLLNNLKLRFPLVGFIFCNDLSWFEKKYNMRPCTIRDISSINYFITSPTFISVVPKDEQETIMYNWFLTLNRIKNRWLNKEGAGGVIKFLKPVFKNIDYQTFYRSIMSFFGPNSKVIKQLLELKIQNPIQSYYVFVGQLAINGLDNLSPTEQLNSYTYFYDILKENPQLINLEYYKEPDLLSLYMHFVKYQDIDNVIKTISRFESGTPEPPIKPTDYDLLWIILYYLVKTDKIVDSLTKPNNQGICLIESLIQRSDYYAKISRKFIEVFDIPINPNTNKPWPVTKTEQKERMLSNQRTRLRFIPKPWDKKPSSNDEESIIKPDDPKVQSNLPPSQNSTEDEDESNNELDESYMQQFLDILKYH